MTKETPITLEQLIPFLQDNHIYPSGISKNDKGVIDKLEINCSPITMYDKKEYLEKLLAGKKVVVSTNTNQQYLEIRKKK